MADGDDGVSLDPYGALIAGTARIKTRACGSPQRPSSVAEDGRRLVADPLPEWGGAREPGVVDQLLGEVSRLRADRADEQLTAVLGELLEEQCERRPAPAGDGRSETRQSQAEGLLGVGKRAVA